MSIITFKQLQENFGGSSPADVVVRLEKMNVKFLIGKNNRPFTTEQALNYAMGIFSPPEFESLSYNDNKPNEIEVM